MTGSASAEPIETWAPVACESNANLICNEEYDDLPGISITMDVYMPPAGQTYPAVILIHGGGWESGDKRSQFMIDRAEYLADRGLVAVAINYRLTCDPLRPSRSPTPISAWGTDTAPWAMGPRRWTTPRRPWNT